MKIVLAILALLLVGIAIVLGLAELRWRSVTSAFVARLGEGAPAPPPGVFSAASIDTLPAPVRRYLLAVLREGQPIARRCRMTQRGEFLVRPEKKTWGPFTAVEYFTANPPGFVWDARIRMAPGVPVRVRDGFVRGAGHMRGSVMGLVPVIAVEGTREIAEGALVRYLAEATWCPTMLLPAAGVSWSAIDDRSARATLEAGGTSVSLDFRFGPDGLVESVFAPARSRDVNGVSVPTPWVGRFSEYAERGGMRIPLAGEVGWVLPEGERPYWRGRVVEVVCGVEGK